MAFNYVSTPDPKELAYDLRQVYAVNILGELLKLMTMYHAEGDFYNWFRLLKHIKTASFVKWEKKEAAIIEYDKLVKDIEIIAAKNRNAWIKKSNDFNQIAEIEFKLSALETFIWIKIEKLLGETARTPGLM